MDPTNRRSLIAAAGATGVALTTGTVPATAREVDPQLADHWRRMLGLLARQDAMDGAHDVLGVVRREVGVIAEHRQVATGDTRTLLLGVEARWALLASWLSNERGHLTARDEWARRALKLAHAAEDRDMTAYVLMRQARWLEDPEQVAQLAEVGERRAIDDGVTGLCSLARAYGHALAGREQACRQSLDDAADTPVGVDLGGLPVTAGYVRSERARCMALLDPAKAIAEYDDTLKVWPSDRPRGRALHQARLALACVDAGDVDRAATEGLGALENARHAKSTVTDQALARLDRTLVRSGSGSVEVRRFREAYTAA